MIVADLVEGLVACVALLLLLIQTPRRWHDLSFRALLLFVACWAASWPFVIAADQGHGTIGLDAMGSRTVEHVLRMTANYGLIMFFVYAARSRPRARRHALVQLLALVAALITIVAAATTIPTGLRGPAAALTTGTPNGPVGATEIGVFYVVANLYMGAAFAVAMLWAGRRRRGATDSTSPDGGKTPDAAVRRSLAIAEPGLACISISTIMVLSADIIRWVGVEPPQMLALTAIPILFLGFVLFLAGLLALAAIMRWRAIPVWRAEREWAIRLRPLWLVLRREFPGMRTGFVMPPWWDHLPIFVHGRFDWRERACYDGMHKLSPFLTELGLDVGTARISGEDVLAALRLRRSGTVLADEPVRVLLPPPGGTRRDELLRLADEMDAALTNVEATAK